MRHQKERLREMNPNSTNPVFNRLHAILASYHDSRPAVSAQSFDHPGFSEGVGRFDSTHVYQGVQAPDAFLIENWPYHLPQGESQQTTRPRPRFMLSLGGNRLVTFDRWENSKTLPLRHQVLPVRLPLQNLSVADVTRQNVNLPQNFDFRRFAAFSGLVCLTPEEQNDQKKLFLSFAENGARAMLQIGNDVNNSLMFMCVRSSPLIDAKQTEEFNKATSKSPIVISDDRLFSREEHSRYFDKTKIHVASHDSSQQGEPTQTLEEILADMNKLVGLQGIKKQVRSYAAYQNFIRLRRENGIIADEELKLHAVLTGNPGTGKTTVAKMLGRIYHSLGLLSKGHVVKVDRSDLVAGYIGQTAPKVRQAIEQARGGVLFIDEAYALAKKGGSEKDFGAEALEILIQEMSDGEGDIAIIFAGYPREMEGFIQSNPGVRSRISQYHFEDYNPEELFAIARKSANDKGLILSDEVQVFLQEQLKIAFHRKSSDFGNARFVVELLQQAKINMAMRVMSSKSESEITPADLTQLRVDDLQNVLNQIEHRPAAEPEKRVVVQGFFRR